MQHLAQHPDDEVSIEVVKELLGLKGRAVGGVVGALRRRCKNHFKRPLPFESHWGRERGMRYRMDAETAAWINEVR